jgi:hypothetical protein
MTEIFCFMKISVWGFQKTHYFMLSPNGLKRMFRKKVISKKNSVKERNPTKLKIRLVFCT